ncbi:DUF5333 family protein [Aliiruegeria lutimaris]|uniref:Uncharacterized protein n=1 Tax=Aliiruegeria lutimaris TaxID=571298 RepID=A0A1G8J589_9RHOB|nr:DUF5333 family protein [Aliiruegeria lutimaris]SDI26193.1 hypothetical protein SAMN04488026_1001220 [Aliiruegeria lutimaris]
MKILALTAMGISMAASGATAQELRPAPGYFVDAMVSITTAENIATACPNLTFNAVAASDATAEVMEKLAADGFDAENLEGTMADPGDAVRGKQATFREKHKLAKDETDFIRVCMAGFAEIKESTQVGSFLAEITGEGAVDPTKDGQGG